MCKNSWVKKASKFFLLSLLIVTLVVTNSLGIVSAQDDSVSSQSTEITITAPNRAIDSQSTPSEANATVKCKWELSVSKSKITVTFQRTSGIFPIYGSGTIKITDAKGNETSKYKLEKSIVSDNIKTWTWDKPISATTVEETVRLDCVMEVEGSIKTGKAEVNRNNFAGGKYGSLKALDGERHHCFAKEIYSKTTVYKYDENGKSTGTVTTYSGPAVLMTVSDHKNTASCNNTSAAKKYREEQLELVKKGKYLEALEKDIIDIQSKYDHKYDRALQQMYNYAKNTLHWTE